MSLWISLTVGIAVFAVLFLLLGSKAFNNKGDTRIKSVVKGLHQQQVMELALSREEDIFKSIADKGLAYAVLKKIPFLSNVPELLPQTGRDFSPGSYMVATMICIGIFVGITQIMSFRPSEFSGLVAIGAAIAAGMLLPKKYIQYVVEKRSERFINLFPDAIDMIVRSVKSGHPLNAALKMIAENMEYPVSTEFKQVVDEISYGRSLTEALYRLSERVGQTDMQFFVVVLAVQQETGGNLAEVLNNLSGIIRKRKQLRLKIKAMTSEARLTAYVLGSLPFFLMLVLTIAAPNYLDPMYHNPKGRVVLFIAIGLVTGAIMMMRKIIKIDI